MNRNIKIENIPGFIRDLEPLEEILELGFFWARHCFVLMKKLSVHQLKRGLGFRPYPPREARLELKLVRGFRPSRQVREMGFTDHKRAALARVPLLL